MRMRFANASPSCAEFPPTVSASKQKPRKAWAQKTPRLPMFPCCWRNESPTKSELQEDAVHEHTSRSGLNPDFVRDSVWESTRAGRTRPYAWANLQVSEQGPEKPYFRESLVVRG